LTPPVVGEDDAVAAELHDTLGVLDALDAFDQELVGPHFAQPRDVLERQSGVEDLIRDLGRVA